MRFGICAVQPLSYSLWGHNISLHGAELGVWPLRQDCHKATGGAPWEDAQGVECPGKVPLDGMHGTGYGSMGTSCFPAKF